MAESNFKYKMTINMASGKIYTKTLSFEGLNNLLNLIKSGVSNVWNTTDDDGKNIIIITNQISDMTWEG